MSTHDWRRWVFLRKLISREPEIRFRNISESMFCLIRGWHAIVLQIAKLQRQSKHVKTILHACVYMHMYMHILHIFAMSWYINLTLGQWCGFPQYPRSMFTPVASWQCQLLLCSLYEIIAVPKRIEKSFIYGIRVIPIEPKS